MRYVQAVKLWNAEEHTVSTPTEVYAIPRKGTESYNEVRTIMKKPVGDAVKIADISKTSKIETPVVPASMPAPMLPVTRKIKLKKAPTPPVEIKEETKPTTESILNIMNGLLAENQDEGEFDFTIDFNDAEYSDLKNYKYDIANYIKNTWIPGFEKENTLSKLRKGLVVNASRGGIKQDTTKGKTPIIKASLYKLDDEYNELVLLFKTTAESSGAITFKSYNPRSKPVEFKPNSKVKVIALETYKASK